VYDSSDVETNLFAAVVTSLLAYLEAKFEIEI
jgi:hypothetical protein